MILKLSQSLARGARLVLGDEKVRHPGPMADILHDDMTLSFQVDQDLTIKDFPFSNTAAGPAWLLFCQFRERDSILLKSGCYGDTQEFIDFHFTLECYGLACSADRYCSERECACLALLLHLELST